MQAESAVNVVPNLVDNLGATIVAAGALGTAAFGIVEGLKATAGVGEAGFSRLTATLGALTGPIGVAYGSGWEPILRAHYRGDGRELKKLLRQGVRVGVNQDNAEQVALFLGSVPGPALKAAIFAASTATPANAVSDADRSVIGRYELAADARIDAALTLAQVSYAATARQAAMVIAIGLALGVAWMVKVNWLAGLIVGLVAVPIAPIAKDIASGINAAAAALKGRR
jgi:hypothetical protein